MKSNILPRAAALALAALLAACGDGGGGVTETPAVASVSVTAPSPTMVRGTTAQLTATPRTAASQVVTGKTPTWQSSSDAVATVSTTGLVTAVAPGSVRITATVDGVAGFVDLTVRASVASVRVTPNPAEVAPGGTRQMEAAALDAAGAVIAGTAGATWESADNAIATVDASGVVRGVAGGTVEIRATIEGVRGTATVRVAVPVPTGLRFSSVTAGSLHACGLDAEGRAWCWGQNQAGQLGGTTTDTCAPTGTAVACSRYPVQVSGAQRYTHISASLEGGNGATCAISTDGRPYCWGGNAYGQLGNGTKTSSGSPVAVGVPAGKTFTQVATGERFACALASDGTVHCWGDNFYGTLGTGSASGGTEPTPQLVNTAERFTSISAGAITACGRTAAGQAFCWGRVLPSDEARAPRAMASSFTFAQVAAGGSGSTDHHICGLQADGKVYCWGYNFSGQMGLPEQRQFTTPVLAMGGRTFAKISTGAGYTCGIEAGGTMFCAGRNQNGELGIGTMGITREPTAVASLAWRSVSTGWFSCGIATDGMAYCWGRNDYGQLGSTEGTTCQSQPGVPTIPCALRPVRVRGQD